MKHGKFAIKKEDLLTYLELPTDSHVQVKDDGDYVEVYIVTEGNSELVVDKTSEGDNLRRWLIGLDKYVPRTGVQYTVHKKLESHKGRIQANSDEDAIKMVKEIEVDCEIALVKSELLYYKK